jgi:hypothetical protein
MESVKGALIDLDWMLGIGIGVLTIKVLKDNLSVPKQ